MTPTPPHPDDDNCPASPADHPPPDGGVVRLTSKDIGRLVGVSQATVSNAINRPHLVAPATLAAIERVMADHGYSVNSSARALKSGIGKALGVVVLDVANPFWGEVVKGIETVTAPGRIPLIIGSSNEDAETESAIFQSFESQGVRGILVAPTPSNLPLLRRFRAKGIQVVLLDSEDPQGEFPSISLDHAAGAELAAAYLRDGGHREVALVNGSPEISWCASRSRGFHAGFAGIADARIHEISRSAMTVEEGRQSVDVLLDLLKQQSPITAVFCTNDMLALGVLKGLHERGIAVPGDLSVVGYDDAVFAELLSPGLTTVHQNATAIGRAAALLMTLDADGPQLPEPLQPPHLVVRGSARSLR